MSLLIHSSISKIPSQQWNDLNPSGNPFLEHAFLQGLEETECLTAETGWQPQHLTLYADQCKNEIIGALPLYLKFHSYGEYVFDWAWADAYHRAGLKYYPKLVCAIPFTPVGGSRLLVHPQQNDPKSIKKLLIEGAVQYAKSIQASSVHWLFTVGDDNKILEKQGLLKRTGNQFHWINRHYEDFDQFLNDLTSKRRKQIKREKQSVKRAGIKVEILEGSELQPHHWDLMYAFYRTTIDERGAIPYLTKDFFDHMANYMRPHVVMALAQNKNSKDIVASALFLKSDDALYGRYWGTKSFYDGLHFETCYYQPIQYCIERQIKRFEAGAQGEHKLNRGLNPTPTYSFHWLQHPQFQQAVREYLEIETKHVKRHIQILDQHNPFREEV